MKSGKTDPEKRALLRQVQSFICPSIDDDAAQRVPLSRRM